MHEKQTASFYIDKLNLQAHPEGGFYARTYCHKATISATYVQQSNDERRHLASAIYYLLQKKDYSQFHRIQSDETWHFYKGTSSIIIWIIAPDGSLSRKVLGDDICAGEFFQFTVPANSWFASELSDKRGFALVGCTVYPGFDFEDFELSNKSSLLEEYPEHQKVIKRLA